MRLDAIVEALVFDETLTDEQRMAAIDRVCDASSGIERERRAYANRRLLRDCRDRHAGADPGSRSPTAVEPDEQAGRQQESLRQMLEEIRAMDRRQGELDRQAEAERRRRAARS